MADRRWPRARSDKILHHYSKHARQRPVIVAEQHAGALQWPALSAGDGLRQCPRAAPSRHREVWHRAYPARDRLVDGRAADFPLGRALSRHDGPDRAILRLCGMLASQLGFTGGRKGKPYRGRSMEGRLVHREAAAGIARGGAGLCRLGFFASVLSPETGYRGVGLLLSWRRSAWFL